jgi:mannose-6-phosphate isomerase-like protein (cupin superfamily)
MDEPRRGRLRAGRAAPDEGEETVVLATVGGAVVEQILSGRLDAPVDYLAGVDEWVVVLGGRATLEVAGELLELHAGDWVLLPAGTPHRLVDTDPGTNWLTVTGRA